MSDRLPDADGRPHRLGPLVVPRRLTERHGHAPGDVLLEDMARHDALTVCHETWTCRTGDVVDPDLRATGVGRLRVADAGVLPDVISGSTNAPAVMIGEMAAELVEAAPGVRSASAVGAG